MESRFKQFKSYGEQAFQTIHKLLRAGFSNNSKVMESRLFKLFTSYWEQAFQIIHKLLRAGFSNNLKVMESRPFKQFSGYFVCFLYNLQDFHTICRLVFMLLKTIYRLFCMLFSHYAFYFSCFLKKCTGSFAYFLYNLQVISCPVIAILIFIKFIIDAIG